MTELTSANDARPWPRAGADGALEAIAAEGLGKAYRIYARPADRVLECIGRRRRHQQFWALRDVDFAVRRGEAFGLYHALTGLGALPASILFGVIYSALGKQGGRVAFLCGAGLVFVAMVLLIVLVRERVPRPRRGGD